MYLNPFLIKSFRFNWCHLESSLLQIFLRMYTYFFDFQLWMCGGQMENIPCSRVGHVYRRNVPYTYDKPNAVLVNFKRVAEVWMDDFKEFLYQRRPEIRDVNPGDISGRKQIREKLKCKSFTWFLNNVANDTVRTRYEPDRGYGQVSIIVFLFISLMADV